MLVFIGVLIIIASVLIGIIVLIQNPKGGGLSGTFGGFGNQVMGVRQTTDVLEKGTWTLAIIIGILCLSTAFFLPKQGRNNVQQDNGIEKAIMNRPASSGQAPATLPLQGAQPQTPPPAQQENNNK